MEKLEECISYFKGKTYNRVFGKMRKKYESYGKWEGNITLENPTEEEKDSLSGFMKKDYSKNKSITISLKSFEKRLQETRFSDIPLKLIIEKYDGRPLVAKKIKLEENKNKEKEFYSEILNENQDGASFHILEKLLNDYSNSFLKRQYVKDKEELRLAIRNACLCFNKLPNEKMKLPVFSAQVIKNPHGLDRDGLTGRIFTRLLSIYMDKTLPNDSEEMSELYFQNNLLIDDVSNMVLCKNIRAYTCKRRTSGVERFLG